MNRGGKNNGIYAAETILKQRTKDGKVWYLMKWKGYSPRFNTWEPEENVLDDRLLKAYRKRLTDSKGKLKRKRSKPTEEEVKSEADVDVEGGDSSNETTAAVEEDEPHDEDASTSADQPVVDLPKKCRKRRKTNSGDSPSVPVETDKENTETKEVCQLLPVDISLDKVKVEHTSEPCEELTVEVANVKQESPVAAAESASSPITDPPCTSSSTTYDTTTTTTSTTSVETESTSVQISPKTDKDPISTREDSNSSSKDLQQKQFEKKSVLSKSSHFDFLANSIIITDVTTERGTITVKECSAYGDFFVPELGKS